MILDPVGGDWDRGRTKNLKGEGTLDAFGKDALYKSHRGAKGSRGGGVGPSRDVEEAKKTKCAGL